MVHPRPWDGTPMNLPNMVHRRPCFTAKPTERGTPTAMLAANPVVAGPRFWLVDRPRRQSIPALDSGGQERKGLLLHRCLSIYEIDIHRYAESKPHPAS